MMGKSLQTLRRWGSIASRKTEKTEGKPSEPLTKKATPDQSPDPHPDTQQTVPEDQKKRAGGWLLSLAIGGIVGVALGVATNMSPGIIGMISAGTVVLVRIARSVLM